MKKLLPLLFLLLPVVASAYSDHRGRNLDSLERVTARYTPDRLLHASDSEKTEYALACRDLAWGYLNIDGAKCVYYARQAISTAVPPGGRNTVFDMSILIGQVFWAKEQYDSARVHYRRAEDVLKDIEDNWTDPDKHDLEASQARIWATLGNFYAMQDSVEQFTKYYGKAGELFEKWEWWEDCSTLHRNLGEIYLDYGDMEKSRHEYGLALEYAEKSKDSRGLGLKISAVQVWSIVKPLCHLKDSLLGVRMQDIYIIKGVLKDFRGFILLASKTSHRFACDT